MASENKSNNCTIGKKKPNAGWRDALAGAGAGAVSRTAMAPLERLKLLRQLQHTTSPHANNVATTTAPHKLLLGQQTSTWQIFRWVLREQGARSFWRGNTPAVIRVSGTAAINFTALAYSKQHVVGPLLTALSSNKNNNNSGNQQRRHQFIGSLIAGGMAGATSTTLMYPFEFARTRLAMDMGKDNAPTSSSSNNKHKTSVQAPKTTTTRQYRGMTDVVVQICKTDGPLGLYRGYGIALVGGIFYRVLYLGGYDAVKTEYGHYKHQEQQINNSNNNNPTTFLERFALAQAIALTAGTLSYPFDTVRRRMMMQAGLLIPVKKTTASTTTSTTAQPPVHYRNSLHCIRVMWQTEGVRGFFLGLGPNVLRSVGGALLLVAYDTFRTML
eukprot:CAMPEP_0168779874 /NCGR_PEP_ID=MMETSP0725-20121227/7830_1 /TAXON_ID=265536 /ORGANISM="Amphiprora sp., Strain CCMP467" /LENGTH=384 /DNA_ID=CAMNT_0008829703 /DNA_START=61 /DNA_END=1215 /DNA_ORIENTATION=+